MMEYQNIPPSHNMTIYAIAVGGSVSIGSLFLAGILPGILLGLGLMLVSYLVAIKRGYPSGKFPGWNKVLRYFAGALPSLFTVFIILGGILSGIFTATESSGIEVIYSVIVATVVYRSLAWNGFITASINEVKTTAMVLLIIGTSAAFGLLLAVTEVPTQLSSTLLSISDNPLLILLIVNLILLMLGTFMDMSPLIIITTPIFLPVMTGIGMDPIQFGIMLILNLGLGVVTPPVGSVLFVGCTVGVVEAIQQHQQLIETTRSGTTPLKWSVVESIPVHEDIKHEDIKLARPGHRTYVDNWVLSMENLVKLGIKTICYNFMPVIDWTRTDLKYQLPSGAYALRFDQRKFTAFDLFILERTGAEADYSTKEIRRSENDLRKHVTEG